MKDICVCNFLHTFWQACVHAELKFCIHMRHDYTCLPKCIFFMWNLDRKLDEEKSQLQLHFVARITRISSIFFASCFFLFGNTKTEGIRCYKIVIFVLIITSFPCWNCRFQQLPSHILVWSSRGGRGFWSRLLAKILNICVPHYTNR